MSSLLHPLTPPGIQPARLLLLLRDALPKDSPWIELAELQVWEDPGGQILMGRVHGVFEVFGYPFAHAVVAGVRITKHPSPTTLSIALLEGLGAALRGPTEPLAPVP